MDNELSEKNKKMQVLIAKEAAFADECGITEEEALTFAMIYWAAILLQKRGINFALIINSSPTSAQKWLRQQLK